MKSNLLHPRIDPTSLLWASHPLPQVEIILGCSVAFKKHFAKTSPAEEQTLGCIFLFFFFLRHVVVIKGFWRKWSLTNSVKREGNNLEDNVREPRCYQTVVLERRNHKNVLLSSHHPPLWTEPRICCSSVKRWEKQQKPHRAAFYGNICQEKRLYLQICH